MSPKTNASSLQKCEIFHVDRQLNPARQHPDVRAPRLANTTSETRSGLVLPVGGIKEKILAAKRAKIKEIILCEDNKPDIDEIKEEYLKGLTFHYVKDMSEVIDIALTNQKVKNAKKL